jgi:NAD(P)-dependent dehydrogenase (short-subunit alcohol dehydrogenase family)
MKLDRLFDVTDRIALITGGASGLGFAMAEALGINGAKLVLIDKNEAALADACRRLEERAVRCEGVHLDVTDAQAVRREVLAIHQRHARIDIAILNAGISLGPGFDAPAGQLENVPLDTWNKLLDVNLTGAFVMLQAVSPLMKAQRSGRVIIVSSMAGVRSQPSIGYGYIASKAGVVALTRQAALELAPFGVHINGIAPGPFSTQIGGGRINSPEGASRFAEMSPLRRVARPHEIQGVAMLLASDACSFMTGTVIPVDGGMCAQ